MPSYSLYIFILLLIIAIELLIISVCCLKYYEKNINSKQNSEIERANTTDLAQSISNTTNLSNLIDSLIYEEVYSIFYKTVSLHKEYESLNMDKDIEEVANKVYKMIRPEIIQSNDIVYTEESLMTLIIRRTMMTFIKMNSK